MINLLLLTGQLNYSDGVASHLFNLINGLREKEEINIFLGSGGGNSEKKFEKTGIKLWQEKGFVHSARSLRNFTEIVIKTMNFCRRNKIDIIHSHNHYAANIAYYSAKFNGSKSVKTVQTIHGIIPEGGLLSHFKADQFISVSVPVMEYLIKCKTALLKNISLIRHGIPQNEIAKDKKFNLTGETKIVCASRLIHEKGIDTFIRASKIVHESYKRPVKFLIAGSGAHEEELKKLSITLKTDVEFPGEVKDIPELLSSTNIFVIPSRSGSEGFPMTIAEAGFAKSLIISSRFKGFDKIFEENTDGLLFEVDNFRELADKILFALKYPEAVKSMPENFHRKSLKLFNMKDMVEKHLEVYRKCLMK